VTNDSAISSVTQTLELYPASLSNFIGLYQYNLILVGLLIIDEEEEHSGMFLILWQ